MKLPTILFCAQIPAGQPRLSVDHEPGVINAGLLDIERMLQEGSHTLSHFPDMPPAEAPPAGSIPTLLREQLAYDTVRLQAEVETNLHLLTPEQLDIFTAVMSSVDNPAQVLLNLLNIC